MCNAPPALREKHSRIFYYIWPKAQLQPQQETRTPRVGTGNGRQRASRAVRAAEAEGPVWVDLTRSPAAIWTAARLPKPAVEGSRSELPVWVDSRPPEKPKRGPKSNNCGHRPREPER